MCKTFTNILGETVEIIASEPSDATVSINGEVIHLDATETRQLGKQLIDMAEYLQDCEAVSKKNKEDLKLELTTKYGVKTSKEILGEI